MKLVVAPVSYRLRQPIKTARGVLDARRGWQVALEYDGVVGRGEAMPLASFGTESPEACEAALRQFTLAALPQTLAEVRAATDGLDGAVAARFATECALLEHLARRRGVGVARLLSNSPRTELAVNALVEADDASGLAAAAERAVAAGFEVVKVKVAARAMSVDAQRLYAVRRAVGPKVKVRVDANGGWSEASARSLLRGLEALELEVCEQPIAAQELEGLRRLRGQVPCRIAADESLLHHHSFARLLAPDPIAAVDVLVLKPAALGGVLHALELARRGFAAGVESYVTTLMDGPLGRAAAAHLAAALPGEAWAHGLSTVELLDSVAADAFSPVRGRIRLPDVPGWGLP
jgi:o-succinylbenzoate synthase